MFDSVCRQNGEEGRTDHGIGTIVGGQRVREEILRVDSLVFRHKQYWLHQNIDRAIGPRSRIPEYRGRVRGEENPTRGGQVSTDPPIDHWQRDRHC